MKGNVVSLFDESGNMGRPWAEAGYLVHCFDIVNTFREERFSNGGAILWYEADLDNASWHQTIRDMNAVMMFSFSPCDDLAVSGSGHFAAKLERDPDCQARATRRARLIEELADGFSRYMHENPVSVLSTTWRKADFYFHPWEYGGYLPEDDVHPRWPEYIAPRDAYPKKTGIRCGNGFIQPSKRPAPCPEGYSTQHKKLGGKSAKTKQIRSETPRGFARAVFLANNTP